MASSSAQSAFPVEGGCTCKHIRYRMLTAPIITHCCHCTWCQRETGSAFVLHAMMEADRIVLLTPNKPLLVSTPTHSGNGQQVSRCPKCYVALWSDYNSGDLVRMVKVGTLDRPKTCPPGVHIYAENKQPWVVIPGNEKDVPVLNQYYKKEDVWSKEGLERMKAIWPEMEKTE